MTEAGRPSGGSARPLAARKLPTHWVEISACLAGGTARSAGGVIVSPKT